MREENEEERGEEEGVEENRSGWGGENQQGFPSLPCTNFPHSKRKTSTQLPTHGTLLR